VDPGSSPRYPDPRLFTRGFFRPATLLHTAWDAAGATDAVRHMRYADVLRLAQIYEEQERYRRQSEQVGQLIYGQLFNHGFAGMIQNYANLSMILSTFWYRECQLLRRYDEVLGELEVGPAEATSETPEMCRHLPVSCRRTPPRSVQPAGQSVASPAPPGRAIPHRSGGRIPFGCG
jgi:hypothetical protein